MKNKQLKIMKQIQQKQGKMMKKERKNNEK